MQYPSNNQPIKAAQSLDATQWHNMMGRLKDPVVARLVLGYFGQNPRLRDQHPGAFLTASETVKRSHIRYAKAHALGRMVVIGGRTATRAMAWSTSSAVSALRWCWNAIRSLQRELPANANNTPVQAAQVGPVPVFAGRPRVSVHRRRQDAIARYAHGRR